MKKRLSFKKYFTFQILPYNDQKLVSTVTNAAGLSEQYFYDNDGRKTKVITKNGDEILFFYDETGKLAKKSTPEGDTIYQWDGDGRLVSISDSDSTVERIYDLHGRLFKEIQSTATDYPIIFNYNEEGRVKNLRVGNIIQESYQFDPRGSLGFFNFTHLGVSSSYSFGVDELGRRAYILYPNQMEQRVSFDEVSRISTLQYDIGGNLISSYHFTYDSNSNLVNQQEQLGYGNGNPIKTFEKNYVLDKDNRLTQSDSYTQESWTLDAVGNWLGDTKIYNELNQLIEDSIFNYTHDNNGNLLVKAEKSSTRRTEYDWDSENRLIAVREMDGSSTKREFLYKYDGLGRRIERVITSNGTSTSEKFIYVNNNIVLELENDKIKRSYVTGNRTDGKLQMQEDLNNNQHIERDEVFYFTQDHLSSVKELVDEQGSVVQRYRYSAYGETTQEKTNHSLEKLVHNRFGYTGREMEENGLYYYRARYYNPSTGRFLSEDPIGFAGQDYNLYRYVGNNPLNKTDPSGNLAPQAIAVIGSGIVLGVIQGGAALYGGASIGNAARAFAAGFVSGAVGAIGAVSGGFATKLLGIVTGTLLNVAIQLSDGSSFSDIIRGFTNSLKGNAGLKRLISAELTPAQTQPPGQCSE